MNFRVGQGYDVHRLVEGRKLILGGVEIPHATGLLGHSDADALLHAITDALLGAVALGDIGRHFPDTDPRFKGADSRVLLKHVYQLILDRGYQLNNADITVACERPKLAPHNLAMRQSIADVLDVEITQISIKATTTEKLGFTGRQEGILSTATVLISHAK